MAQTQTISLSVTDKVVEQEQLQMRVSGLNRKELGISRYQPSKKSRVILHLDFDMKGQKHTFVMADTHSIWGGHQFGENVQAFQRIYDALAKSRKTLSLNCEAKVVGAGGGEDSETVSLDDLGI